MKFTMKTPCDSCPFVRSTGFILTPARVREIEDAVGSGFPCHKTVDYSEDGPRARGAIDEREIHCAGSLVVQWRQYEGFDGVVSLALSYGWEGVPEGWRPETHLDLDADAFDSFDEMFETMCERMGLDPDNDDDPRVAYGIEFEPEEEEGL